MKRILIALTTFTAIAAVILGCAEQGPLSSPQRQEEQRSERSRSQDAPELATKARPIEKDKQANAAISAGTAAPPSLASRIGNLAAMRAAVMAEGSPAAAIAQQDIRIATEPLDREKYAHLDENSIQQVVQHPVSTFSVDVDTGAYANVRRMLKAGQLPPHDAVRIEEMINYFSYDYPLPEAKSVPFRVITEIAPSPWNANTYLLQVGIKGEDRAKQALPPANLVFLVDVSGSMQPAERLPLLKSGLKLLTQHLRKQDRVSIVVYAGNTGVVLEPTHGDQTARINAAIDALQADGSTNGAAGIKLAYAMAEQGYIPAGINRVLLATDGDFNVGVTSFEALKNLVEDKRKGGVSLTTLGFGMGNYAGTRNYNEQLMEQLADAGNGNYFFIDTLNEAQKVLVEEMSSTLNTIAKDVKIQIEFNPEAVSEYRLIGYENRTLKREDFNNDKVDAGEIGAGHTVTALYEISLRGAKALSVDPLRYQPQAQAPKPHSSELAFLRVRYKEPEGDASTLLEWPISKAAINDNFDQASQRLQFAAAVAGFGQLLKGGKYTGALQYDDVLTLARKARGEDRFGYRAEFESLVNLAVSLAGREAPARISAQ